MRDPESVCLRQVQTCSSATNTTYLNFWHLSFIRSEILPIEYHPQVRVYHRNDDANAVLQLCSHRAHPDHSEAPLPYHQGLNLSLAWKCSNADNAQYRPVCHCSIVAQNPWVKLWAAAYTAGIWYTSNIYRAPDVHPHPYAAARLRASVCGRISSNHGTSC